MTAVDRADPAWTRTLPQAAPDRRASRWARAVRAEPRSSWVAKAACPTCRGPLRAEEEPALADALEPEEQDALRRGRFGFLACDGCDALYPWESA